jgi:hypothetical protein
VKKQKFFSMKLGIEAKSPEAAARVIKALAKIMNPAEKAQFFKKAQKELDRIIKKQIRREIRFTKWPVRSCRKSSLKRSAARNEQQNNSVAKIFGRELLNEKEDGSTTSKSSSG